MFDFFFFLSFWALWVCPAVCELLRLQLQMFGHQLRTSCQRNILQVLSPCSQGSEVDLGKNCLAMETEIAIKRGMAKLCKIRVHE